MKKSQNKVAFFNFLSVVLLRGISLFTAPIFSRLLGTEGYGMVSIYTIWVSAAAIVLTMQVQGTLPTAKVEFPEGKQDAYHSSILFLAFLFFAGCSALIMVFIDPVSRLLGIPKLLVPLILLQAFCNFCVQFMNQKFVYEYRADLNCLTSVAVAVLTMLLSLLFIWLMPAGQGYYGRIFGMVLTYVIVGTTAFFYILRKGKTLYNREFWKFCIPLALPFIFYNLSDLILGQSDRVMLQQMMGKAQVGTYSLAYNLGNVMFIIFGALNTSWCPFFFDDMKYGRRDSVRRQGGNFLEIYTILSMGFVLLHREVFHIFAGKDFWAGTACIPIFVAGYYFNFLCTFPINYEYYHKKTRAVAAVTIVASAVNIGLNYVLISRMGILGAAAATTISHGFQFGLHYLYGRWILGRGDYPFPDRSWILWALGFFSIVVFVWLTEELWVLRWGLGAALGIWELLRLKKRKTIF